MALLIEQRLNAALTLCSVTSAMLKDAGRADVEQKLREIQKELEAGNLDSAFNLYRSLPRQDVADFWESWEWMEEETNKKPPEQKALLAAYYDRTLKALGDLRVTVLYGFERPIVDASHENIATHAKKLLAEKRAYSPNI